jgi:arylsulfatase A-like enzyme
MSHPELETNRKVKNVLFIMCDQLRADALSCYTPDGALQTPHLDRLAGMGMRFDRAFVNSAVCGPSRASYYTGRYPLSHRVTWNRVPHPIDELFLGDYLAAHGRDCHLLGKTHHVSDKRGLAQREFEVDGTAATRFWEGGFIPIERYDGHYEMASNSDYRRYLLDQGYQSEKPWEDYVIGSVREDGEFLSGWHLRHAGLPARVSGKDSETAYLTSRAMDFISAQGDKGWVLHLSYIKPHWPYKAPAPYHNMFGREDCAAPVRSRSELENGHPVHAAYRQHEESLSFARDEVWQTIKPVYMGLVKQIDDQLGRLLAHLEKLGRLDDTLIVFSSDHGDLLGDHWLGEKEYFFEGAIKVPLIVYDPDADADATRGQTSNAFAECVDITPTILDALSIPVPDHRVEGRSLLREIRGGGQGPAREYTVASLDYSYREARILLKRNVQECKGLMLRDGHYKYIYWQGYRPQLFDLSNDPDELCDLGEDSGMAPVRARMQEALFEWHATLKHRATEDDGQVQMRTNAHERMMNILIGRW